MSELKDALGASCKREPIRSSIPKKKELDYMGPIMIIVLSTILGLPFLINIDINNCDSILKIDKELGANTSIQSIHDCYNGGYFWLAFNVNVIVSIAIGGGTTWLIYTIKQDRRFNH